MPAKIYYDKDADISLLKNKTIAILGYGSQDHVERDLMLISVSTASGSRSEIYELTNIFRGRIVDVAHDMVMIEMSGQERKIEAFIEMMRPFGIVELVRTGRIAMVRGRSGQ